jgi:phosphoadenosine phosphosulfate reductase
LNEFVEIKCSESSAATSPEHAEVDGSGWSARKVLRWAYRTYEDGIAIASAFGVEGMVLIDMAAQVRPQPRVFVLDTSFLFPETYRLIEQVESRYGISVQRVLPALCPEAQAKLYGAELWNHDPDLCCHLRKVEPLQRQLADLRAWVTSIRRDQTQDRSHTRKVTWDPKFRIMKINPLADWSGERVWRYVRERKLPYNPLHDRNYPSIGCVHCTRSVKPGENPRAGRWPGFQKTECGLHTPGPDAPLH